MGCVWGNHWLQVELRGADRNREAVGAVAVATLGSRRLREEVVAGSTSAHSSRWKTLHFGLADATTVDELEITWPNGDVEVLTDIDADQRLVLVEGE